MKSQYKYSFKEPKPIYALTAIEKVEYLDNYKGRSGTFIKGFLMNDKRNKNGWRTTWESIKAYASDFVNHPGTYLEIGGVPDHPDGATYKQNMANQEHARVTNIVAVQLCEDTHTAHYVAEILPAELSELDFKAMLDDGKVDYTSPGIWPEEFEVVGTMENGKPALDVFKWRALHYSYINDPAYGKDTAGTVGTCEGDGVACSMQLAAKLYAQNNTVHVEDTTPCPKDKQCPESTMEKNIVAQVEDPLAPLIQKPIILKKLKSLFCAKGINELHARLLNSNDVNDCVSRKIKIIMRENPDMPKDQQLAIAFSFCRQQGLEELAKDLDERVPVRIISV